MDPFFERFDMSEREQIDKAYEAIIDLVTSPEIMVRNYALTMRDLMPVYERLAETVKTSRNNRDVMINTLRGTSLALLSMQISLVRFVTDDPEGQALGYFAMLKDLHMLIKRNEETKGMATHIKAALDLMQPVQDACLKMTTTRSTKGRH